MHKVQHWDFDDISLNCSALSLHLCSSQVYSVNFDGSNIRTVLTDAVHSVQNVAVDWINFKLYVLEARVERIDVCDFDGGNRVVLVAENLHTPYGLALDPTVGSVLGRGNGVRGKAART